MPQQVQHTPALRFSEFHGNWKEGQIGSSLTIGSGRDYKHLEVGDIPVYGTGGYMTSVNDFLYDGKSVGIGRKGTINKPVFLTGKFWTVDTLFYTHSYKNITPEFVYALFQRIDWLKYNEASGVPSLSKATIEKIKIHIPDQKEQQKIAAFLDAVDEKIAGLQKKKDLLREYKKGCMQRLFSQQIRFTDDNGKPFPCWEEKKLGTVYDWVSTNSLSRENLTYEADVVQNIHYGDIHTSFHKNFRQSKEVVPFIAGAKKNDFNKENFICLGDVVIADASEDYADIGKAIEVIELNDTPLVAGLHTYIARPKQKTLALGFSCYLFQSPAVRKQIMKIAQGISVLGVSKGNLEKIDLFLPHPDEQKKIANFLSAIDHKIALVSEELDKAKTFKKGLLQQMFV